MKNLGNIILTIIVLLFIGLIGYGLFYGGKFAWETIIDPGSRNLSDVSLISLSVIFSSLIIAYVISTALKRERKYNLLPQKVDLYKKLIDKCAAMININETADNNGSVKGSLSADNIITDIILLADKNILRDYAAFEKLVNEAGTQNPKTRIQFEKMIGEMRKELNQSYNSRTEKEQIKYFLTGENKTKIFDREKLNNEKHSAN